MSRPAARRWKSCTKLMHFVLGSLAGQHTHHHAVFRVKGHMVPMVSLPGIGWFLGVAMLLFLAHERPLRIELDFAGLRGKKPRVRRGLAERADQRLRPVERPYSCSLPPGGWSGGRHNPPEGGAARRPPCRRVVCSARGPCLCVRRSVSGMSGKPGHGLLC